VKVSGEQHTNNIILCCTEKERNFKVESYISQITKLNICHNNDNFQTSYLKLSPSPPMSSKQLQSQIHAIG